MIRIEDSNQESAASQKKESANAKMAEASTASSLVKEKTAAIGGGLAKKAEDKNILPETKHLIKQISNS